MKKSLLAVLFISIFFSPAYATDEGLVAYYSFDEGGGSSAYDYSGNENDGTVYGAAWTEGVSGGALAFDGVDDYVWLAIHNLLELSIPL